jgi:hypothetical protein
LVTSSVASDATTRQSNTLVDYGAFFGGHKTAVSLRAFLTCT